MGINHTFKVKICQRVYFPKNKFLHFGSIDKFMHLKLPVIGQ